MGRRTTPDPATRDDRHWNIEMQAANQALASAAAAEASGNASDAAYFRESAAISLDHAARIADGG